MSIKNKRQEERLEEYKKWKFFDPINQVLGHTPATRPPIVIESSDITSCITNSDENMMEDQKVTEDQLDEQDTEIMSESSSKSRSRSETPINEKKECE